jgi:transposase
MRVITIIGLDIAKSVFQVHGIDAEGNVLIRRQLKRRYVLTFFEKLLPCLVGIEACAKALVLARTLARPKALRKPPSLGLWRAKRQTRSSALRPASGPDHQFRQAAAR